MLLFVLIIRLIFFISVLFSSCLFSNVASFQMMIKNEQIVIYTATKLLEMIRKNYGEK